MRFDHADSNAYPDTYANADTHTDSNAHSYTDTNSDSDANPHSGLQRVCRGHTIQLEPGRHQCGRLLPMHGPRLVLFDGGILLRARYRLGLDLGMDAGDCSLVRRYHTDSDPDAHSYTDTYSHANADSESHTDAYTDAYTDTNPNPNPNPNANARHLRRQVGTDGQGLARLLGKLGWREERRAPRHGLDSAEPGTGQI